MIFKLLIAGFILNINFSFAEISSSSSSEVIKCMRGEDNNIGFSHLSKIGTLVCIRWTSCKYTKQVIHNTKRVNECFAWSGFPLCSGKVKCAYYTKSATANTEIVPFSSQIETADFDVSCGANEKGQCPDFKTCAKDDRYASPEVISISPNGKVPLSDRFLDTLLESGDSPTSTQQRRGQMRVRGVK